MPEKKDPVYAIYDGYAKNLTHVFEDKEAAKAQKAKLEALVGDGTPRDLQLVELKAVK